MLNYCAMPAIKIQKVTGCNAQTDLFKLEINSLKLKHMHLRLATLRNSFNTLYFILLVHVGDTCRCITNM